MNSLHRYTQILSLALAAFVTLVLLGSIDGLAYEQHAAVRLARTGGAAADVAVVRQPAAKRS